MKRIYAITAIFLVAGMSTVHAHHNDGVRLATDIVTLVGASTETLRVLASPSVVMVPSAPVYPAVPVVETPMVAAPVMVAPAPVPVMAAPVMVAPVVMAPAPVVMAPPPVYYGGYGYGYPRYYHHPAYYCPPPPRFRPYGGPGHHRP